jgi:hypothetical protein
MEEIKVIDNFLDETDLDILFKKINNTQWKYGHGTGGKRETISTRFFSTSDFDEYYREHIREKIEKAVNKKLKINRLYMHLQTFGQDGGYHIDDTGKNKYSFCVYINKMDLNEIVEDEDNENKGGEFFFKVPEEKFILCFEAKFNRGIFFPSEYLHRGMPYTNSMPRMCLTYKLEEI